MTSVLERYVGEAPLPLAFERALECRLYEDVQMERPILDLGCGDGLFAELAFEVPVDTGLDPDPKELQLAGARRVYDELLQCSGASIPKEDGTYGTVVANSVLEHIPDLDPVLGEAHRILKPGGRFYATVPSDRFEEYTWIHLLLKRLGLGGIALRWRGFFNRFWRHHNVHDAGGWAARFEGAGFEVERTITYDPKRLCVLNDALVPFAFPSFVLKRSLNRWTVLPPKIRTWLMKPWMKIAEDPIGDDLQVDDGGLVFVTARKP